MHIDCSVITYSHPENSPDQESVLGSGSPSEDASDQYVDVNELLRSTNREYQTARGSPDGTVQLALFGVKTGGGLFEN